MSVVYPVCEKTYNLTKELHILVDKHLFFKNFNETQYVDMIKYILSLLQPRLPSELYYLKLDNLNTEEIKKLTHSLFDKIIKDLTNPVAYMSQVYLWYLSLMAGGRILKSKLKDENHYLVNYTNENRRWLKNYIDSCGLEHEIIYFVKNVSETYKLIKEYLDYLVKSV